MKSIKYFALLGLFMISQALIAQDVMELEHFDEISVTGIIQVKLIQSDEEKLELTTNNFHRHDVKVRVEQGVLRISVTKSLIKDANVDITVFYKQIRRIKANAGARVSAKEIITGDKLDLKANSGAKIELEVKVNDMHTRLAEGSQMYISGSTESLNVSAASGAVFHGYELSSDYTYSNANTGARIRVVANKSIEAGANTGGRVTYKGNPEDKDLNDYWGGEVDEY